MRNFRNAPRDQLPVIYAPVHVQPNYREPLQDRQHWTRMVLEAQVHSLKAALERSNEHSAMLWGMIQAQPNWRII